MNFDSDIITLNRLSSIIKDSKNGLDPDLLSTWYRIVENEAKTMCPDHLKDKLTMNENPILSMKFNLHVSKRVVHYLIDAIENNLSKMPFSTKLYFQKVQTILLDELSSYNDKK